MSTANNNRGSLEWQALAERGHQSPMRSRASSAFEQQLRTLLANYGGSDISGLWVDWTIPSKEPLWIPFGAGEAA